MMLYRDTRAVLYSGTQVRTHLGLKSKWIQERLNSYEEQLVFAQGSGSQHTVSCP